VSFVDPLYFRLAGTEYQNGDVLLITDIEMSLTCVTSNVNTLCCTTTGNVGLWLFPDGTLVPNDQGQQDDFTKTGTVEEVRLNRRNNAMVPTGAFTCRVLDQNIFGSSHVATIILTTGVCIYT